MANGSDDSDTNYWPGFVDALSTMTMMLIFLMMILSLVLVSVSQNVTKSQVIAIARAAKIDVNGSPASIEGLTAQIIAALSRTTDAEKPKPPYPLKTDQSQAAHPVEQSAQTAYSERANLSADQGNRVVAKGDAESLQVQAAKSDLINGSMPRLDLPLQAIADAAIANREKLQIDPGENVFRKGESADLKLEVAKSPTNAEPRPSAQIPLDTTNGIAISQQPNLAVDQGNRIFSKGESDSVQYNRSASPNSDRKDNPASVPADPEAKGFVAERPKLGVNQGDKTVSEGLPDSSVTNGKSSVPSVAERIDPSPTPATNPPKSSQLALLEPLSGPATFSAAKPSPDETRIVSTHQADLDPFGGGVDVQVDKPMLTMVYEPRAIRLDGNATLKLQDFFDRNKVNLADRRIRIRALANVRDGAVTDARRFGYYRAMSMRQLLIDQGFPANKIVVAIDDVSDSESRDIVEIFAIRKED
ncbi:MAG: hypothetical protein RLZZ496_46 [Pseudomonadota bacterium]